jgi:endonuclease/exonuclease/phosphatase family metal-dependent hydrolase
MRIVAWNINHRSKPKKALFPEVSRVCCTLAPDVLVLTEYVHAESPAQAVFLQQLRDAGLPCITRSPHENGHNSVLIASAKLHTRGGMSSPTTTIAAHTNFLHVQLDMSMELLGMRVPCYKLVGEKDDYWRQMVSVLAPFANRRFVVIGDFNLDPNEPKCEPATVRPHLAELRRQGWRFVSPEGDWSYRSVKESVVTSRLDHVIASKSVVIRRAQYMCHLDGVPVCGSKGAVSDHAPLLVDVEFL